MSTGQSSFDLAVIGSGGAAFAAAIAARTKGAKVVMVERGTIGGTCVNTGCVPSKALLAAAEARHVALAQPFPGIRSDAGSVDFATLIGGKRALVGAMRADKYENLAAEYEWPILTGDARFIPGPRLQVALANGGTTAIEATHYVIATGSAPWAPPIDGLAEAGYLTSTTAMELDVPPTTSPATAAKAAGDQRKQPRYVTTVRPRRSRLRGPRHAVQTRRPQGRHAPHRADLLEQSPATNASLRSAAADRGIQRASGPSRQATVRRAFPSGTSRPECKRHHRRSPDERSSVAA